jgi:hypothetical protein
METTVGLTVYPIDWMRECAFEYHRSEGKPSMKSVHPKNPDSSGMFEFRVAIKPKK